MKDLAKLAEQFTVTELRQMLESKPGVFFATYWSEEDLETAIKDAGLKPTPEFVQALIPGAKEILFDSEVEMAALSILAKGTAIKLEQNSSV